MSDIHNGPPYSEHESIVDSNLRKAHWHAENSEPNADLALEITMAIQQVQVDLFQGNATVIEASSRLDDIIASITPEHISNQFLLEHLKDTAEHLKKFPNI